MHLSLNVSATNSQQSQSQNTKSYTFKGKVVDVDRKPIAGVAVQVKSTTKGVVTDKDGFFEVSANLFTENKPTLIFSFLGMVKQEIAYNGRSFFVVMEADNMAINTVEVVYTGYQEISTRELTSSITTVKADDIMNPSFTSIDQMLEGRVPGVTFLQSSGQMGAAPKLRIRGTTTVFGSQEPLWVVDGIVQEEAVNVDPQQINDLDFVNLLGSAISGINPEDIQQIDVLKDASATAIYGKRAANGVIVVTTKKGNIGAPKLTYSMSATVTERPKYTDNTVNMMNSAERLDLSRSLIESRQVYPNVSSWVGYEAAYRDYVYGNISFDQFSDQVGYYETINTDWFDLLTQNSLSTKHTLSLSGGSSSLRYYTSIGIDDTKGTIEGEKNTRYNATANITGTYKKLTVKVGLTGNVQDKTYVPSDIDVLQYAYNTSRAIPATNPDGSYWYYDREPAFTEGGSAGSTVFPFNILEDVNNSSYNITGNGLTSQVALDYEVSKPIKLNAVFSYSFSNTDQETYHGPNTHYGKMLNKSYNARTADFMSYTLMPVGGELQMNNTNRNSYSGRIAASYDKTIGSGKDHRITATLGAEVASTEYNTLAQTYRGYVPERGNIMASVDLSDYYRFRQWMQTKEALGIRSYEINNDLSTYLSAGYGYKDHFFVSLNTRVDFSNEFGSRANEKFFPIWAVSGRWNLNNSVVKNVDWIDELALRASFGLQGNVPSVPTKLIIEKGTTNPYFGDEYMSTISKYPNPDLKWEKTASTNVAVDFALFDKKIRGTFEYYYRRTTDAYVNEAVSAVNGISNYSVNRGTLVNHGYDITLNFTPINNMSNINGDYKGFSWRFDPQLGQIVNKLLDKVTATNSNTLLTDSEIFYNSYLNGNTPVKGYGVNSFFSYNFAGLSDIDGRPTFKGLEDEITVIDGVEIPTIDLLKAYGTNEERILSVMDYSGSRTPLLQGGFNNTFSFNNISIGLNLTYSLGSKIRLLKLYPNVSESNGTIAPNPTENVRREFLDRWRNPGDEKYTNIPGIIPYSSFDDTMDPWWVHDMPKQLNPISSNIWNMYDYSDVRVASGDYLKIQSVSVRYNFPKKLCEKLTFSSAYVSFIGTNLYTFKSKDLVGQDPTTQSGSSQTLNMSVRPSYTLSLNVSF